MSVSFSSAHYECDDIGTSNTIEKEKWNDLTVKFESLEHELKKVRLENEHYRHHTQEVQHQNLDLQTELAHYEDKMNRAKHLKPMLKIQQNSIHARDEEIELLRKQVSQQQKLIKSLQSRNNEILQKNNKFDIALEESTKANETLVQKNVQNQNKIFVLQNEINILTRLATMNTANQTFTPQSDAYTPLRTPSSIEFPDNPIIPFQKTVELNRADFGTFMPESNPTVSFQKTVEINRAELPDLATIIPANNPNISQYLTTESVQWTNWKSRNAHNIETVEETEPELDHECNKFVSVMGESKYEMEKVFIEEEPQMCDELGKDNLIEKYTWLWFEFQLRFAKR